MNYFSVKYFSIVLTAVAGVVLFYSSCSKDHQVPPANPYDVVNYNTDTTTEQNPDPYSIAGLHKNIFNVKCNVPAWHDGTFEPDFRSVQSTYSTLVYQPVNKITVNFIDTFKYRVIPYDTANSFLHERVVTTTPDFMPRPEGGPRLTPTQVQQINTWIMNGAKDMSGNIPSAPNNLPFLVNDGNHFFYNALDSLTLIPFYASIVDSNRYMGVPYNPFLVNANANLRIIFWVGDDSTAMVNLLVNQCKLSLLENDFSAAQIVSASYINAGASQFWMVIFPVTWAPGTHVYFRYYLKDTNNPAGVECPRSDLPVYYKLFFSFIVQ